MIVAFSGPKGSGKSTAMGALDPRPRPAIPGYIRDNWIHLPFAGPLKAMLAELIGRDAITDRELREKPHPLLGGKTPRYAMQTLGTEWGRDIIDPDLWVNVWREQAEAVLKAGGHVVTDDLRFPNEEQVVRYMGGYVIEVRRPGLRRDRSHASESYAPQHDVAVENNGAPDDLKDYVLSWLRMQER